MIKVEMTLDEEQLYHAWFALEQAAQRMGACVIGSYLHRTAENLRLAYYYHFENEINDNKQGGGRWRIPEVRREE